MYEVDIFAGLDLTKISMYLYFVLRWTSSMVIMLNPTVVDTAVMIAFYCLINTFI